MPLAEVADGAEIGDVFADDDPKGHVRFTASHQAAGGDSAGSIAVQQERDQHGGVIGRLASFLRQVRLQGSVGGPSGG